MSRIFNDIFTDSNTWQTYPLKTLSRNLKHGTYHACSNKILLEVFHFYITRFELTIGESRFVDQLCLFRITLSNFLVKFANQVFPSVWIFFLGNHEVCVHISSSRICLYLTPKGVQVYIVCLHMDSTFIVVSGKIIRTLYMSFFVLPSFFLLIFIIIFCLQCTR